MGKKISKMSKNMKKENSEEKYENGNNNIFLKENI